MPKYINNNEGLIIERVSNNEEVYLDNFKSTIHSPNEIIIAVAGKGYMFNECCVIKNTYEDYLKKQ